MRVVTGVVMRIAHETGVIGNATGGARVGHYVESYDAEAYDGRGDVATTPDVEKARVFASPAEAMEAWRTVPKARPLRADGQPNRPLTAFTVEILPRSEA